MDWQPIETAPKDGTPILGWPGTMNGYPYVVQYSHGLWREADGELYHLYEPTHWMPLPEPPALGEKE